MFRAMAKVMNIWLDGYRSFGHIERTGRQIRLTCRKCDVIMEPDLRVLMWYLGRSASPIDLFPRCKVWGCGGQMFFQGQAGGMWMPLVTEFPLDRQQPPR